MASYLKKRGFSPAVWERRGVGECKGAVAMPYYENGNLVLVKFRPAHKPGPNEKKGWREPGGKAVFWGMDLCTPDKPLVICEGEMDALALDEAIENVVSVPSGAEDLTCVGSCWTWLDKFKRIIIWADNDVPGRKLERNLIQRLGAWRCSVVRHSCKDANEVLLLHGKQAVADAVAGAVGVPMEGLIALADVPMLDYRDVARARSGIRGIDQTIGGFMMGELSVWTGINGSGKSTLLGQLLLDAVDQGFAVCVYSGELPARMFRYWIDLQAAGPQFLEMRHDLVREQDVPHVAPDVAKKIRAWYRDKFYLFDSFGAAKDSKILEVFEYAARRHGCKIFMVDNLMTTVFTGNDRDFYRQQSNFIGQLKDFAHRLDVHVYVVAHPRKTQGRLTKMDISGSGDISNRADNVFSVHRCDKQEAAELGCDTMIDIFKNRFSGRQDVSVQLLFDSTCKRFCMAGECGKIGKKYGWLETKEGDYSLEDF
ncbi:bifunctional DNA primase/helicase [Desulfoscipio sp. XC116]|uniref:bifunctional DNA primase/helicase n=1 Tax=Desulfoscipio sp. XC116 TaxID=3144975 RepID=UPI00325B6302